jgi:hypothetical protein
MSPAAKLVPQWARLVTGLVALLNLAFGLTGYFAPASVLPGLPAEAAALHAAYIFSARNVAIGLALLIVSIVGVPESIAIVMIIRFLVEAQDLVLSLLAGAGFTAVLMPLGFIVVELVIVVTMFRIVGAQHQARPSAAG